MGAETGMMGHATQAGVRIVATVVVAYAIATAIRFSLVERDDLGSIAPLRLASLIQKIGSAHSTARRLNSRRSIAA